MKLKYIIPLFFTAQVHAQMVSASFFPDMKSINPATLNQRSHGQVSFLKGKDSIDKLQVGDSAYNEKTTWEIEVDTNSFFYGGKAGKGKSWFNPEIQYLKNSGFRKSQYTANSVEPTTTQNDIDFTHMEVGLGIGKYFGISYARQEYNLNYSFKFTIGSNNFEERKNQDIEGSIIRVGGALPLKFLKIAAFYEQASLSEEVDEFVLMTGINRYSASRKASMIGAGIGFESKKFHMEAGYEMILSSDDLNGSPTRLSGTIEYKIWKIALGYTGRIYQDGFQSNETLVYNEMVYPEQVNESRLENVFNFAYGASGGILIGGSFSTSKVTAKEKNPYYNASVPPQDTEVESTAYTLKIGYVW